ncbi:unknown similar to AMEV132 [Mythimna separata entomopoxvirus 'L']|uniref:KilA-N domain-containing protein n=1 Tax=Mythimna separata entomopoxvirus 'L' TaxID=1293572 RepID=A0A916KQ76_9POXV|nr:unknown similar to AMEV132 [Mythimna separata entomopoxvirus 'L']CCU56341.1 unknown similar to AMEV132 [Mythimna separata entomopoxvirus 'L']
MNIINIDVNNNCYLYYGNFHIIFNKKLKLYNASSMCEFLNININIWLSINSCNITLDLNKKIDDNTLLYIINETRSSLNGIHVSKYVLLNICAWISYECYIKFIDIVSYVDMFMYSNKDNNLIKKTLIYTNKIKEKLDIIIDNVNNNSIITRNFILNSISSNLNKTLVWNQIKYILKWKNSRIPVYYRNKYIYVKY